MAKRGYGTGQLYLKHGAYYSRWRTLDGRKLNRKIGVARGESGPGGLTRAEAERQFRKLQEAEERRPIRAGVERHTLDEATDSLRRRLAVEGARKSYLQNCESMQRVHILPRLGDKPVDRVTIADVETVVAAMLDAGLASKTMRNVITFMHSVFEHAVDRGWTMQNPVRRASRPKSRRAGDANPDIQFLTVPELEAVLRAIPDEVVVRAPAPTRRGRPGSAPPIAPDVLGPVIRVVVLTAAMTGLRQSELLGLRWRDVDRTAQRIRVRNAWVRGEHSAEGQVRPLHAPLGADGRPARTGARPLVTRTLYGRDDDLVFAHPQSGRPLDRTKLTHRFKAACADAGVRPIRFHDLRNTFATRLAASGQPMRTIQEFLGHADSKTTQIYAHYAPSAHEVEMVNTAFAEDERVEAEVGDRRAAT